MSAESPSLLFRQLCFFIAKRLSRAITNLRNRFQGRCKRAVRRSRRRIGRSYWRRARRSLMERRGKRSPFLAKRTGRRYTHSFGVVAIRAGTRKISTFGQTTRRSSRDAHGTESPSVASRLVKAECACFAHCQNVSAVGLSVPFRAASPIGTIFGSGVSGNIFTRFPKT
jgi:hypothetical protein